MRLKQLLGVTLLGVACATAAAAASQLTDLNIAANGNVSTVTFRANGGFTQRFSGTSDLTFPGFRQHSTGVSTSASANTSGNVVGVPIPTFSPGNIGTNQSVTIDIQH